MPQPASQNLSAPTGLNVPLNGAAETVIATLGGVDTQGPGATVELDGTATITWGTGTTAITLRLRRTGLGGTLVATEGPEGGGGAVGQASGYGIQGTDNPGEVSGGVYVLTAQATGATANGSAVEANLQAVVQGA